MKKFLNNVFFGFLAIIGFIAVILIIIFIVPPTDNYRLGGLNSWKNNSISTFKTEGENCLKKYPHYSFINKDKSFFHNTFQKRATRCLEFENNKSSNKN